MDLLLDLGHTRLKWAWREAGVLHAADGVPWQDAPSGDTFARVLAGLARPDRVAIAAVARGEPLLALTAAVHERWGLPAQVPRVAAQCGDVRCGYTDPARLGFDRWAAVIGAWMRQPGHAAIVIDCGSAVTVDALCADGQHLGGIILPGAGMMADAFYARTRLPREGTVAPHDIAARGTAQAVASGARVAVVGGIEHALRAWNQRLPDAAVWLTGGDAPALAGDLPAGVKLAPHLVLEGLGAIMDRDQ